MLAKGHSMQMTQQPERHFLPVILWVLTVSWMVFLTIVLLQSQTQPIINTGIPAAPPSFKRELFFSSMHLIFFGFTACLWVMALSQHLPLRDALIATFVLLVAYGVLTEILQGRSPGRSPQVTDLIANTTGILVGMAILYRMVFRTKQSE